MISLYNLDTKSDERRFSMIGKRMKEVRKLRGYTQEDIANKLAVSVSAVKKWEQDKTDPNTALFVELADYLDVSLDYLLNRSDDLSRIPTVENDLLDSFRQLDEAGQNEVLSFAKYKLTVTPKESSGVDAL